MAKYESQFTALRTGSDSAFQLIGSAQEELEQKTADLRALHQACMSRLQAVEARVSKMSATVVDACGALLAATENEARRVDEFRGNIREIAEEVRR